MESIIRNNQNATKLSNYLKQSENQYPPLNKKQERELIEKYRNDRPELNRLLFMHNIRRVFNMAKSYVAKTDDFDSLIQNGMRGLAEAAKRFDIDRDIKFCTYATIWIKKCMTMPYYSPQYKLDSKTVSMSSPSFAGDHQEAGLSQDETLENTIMKYVDPTAVGVDPHSFETALSANEQSDICGKLYSAMDYDSSLSALDRDVFRMLFVDHEKKRDVAMRYNIDVSAVTEIQKRVLGKFKNILVNQYKIKSYSDIG